MKILFATLFAFTRASLAYAISVGDTSIYTSVLGGQSHEIATTVTLVGDDLYAETTTIDGSSETSNYYAISAVKYRYQVAADCVQNGGTVENVETPIKTFSACKISVGSHIFWASSEVPFGYVKSFSWSSYRTDTIKAFIKH